MRQIRKKAVIVITALLLLSFTTSTFASGAFYEKVESEKLSRGVIQKHIQRFTQNGWLNANVLYIDLTDETSKLDILQSSNGLSSKETLSSMAKKNQNVVGAINSDFFYFSNPDSPMGMMIKDGKMISSPGLVNNFATLYVTDQNTGFANYLTSTMKIITDKGKEVQIQAINKITWEYRMTTLIDRNWGTHSPGADEARPDHVEVVVVDNKVVEVRKGQAPVEIPESGYIIYATGVRANDLLQNLQVGDLLDLKVSMNPDIESIELAIGGGTLLVSNGQAVTNFTQDVSGNHPRTAVGITKDRRQLILVTVDGRHTSYKGLDGKGMANLMIELGSHEAIMMDGGGSTGMVTRGLGEFGTKLATTPSDGSERRIVNSLAIVTTAETGNVNGLKAELENNNVFINTPKKITAKGYDSNFNPVAVDSTKLTYKLLKGSGSFEGNNFIPTAMGEAIVEVEYLGAKTEVKLNVLDTPAYMEITPGAIQLAQGRTANLSVVGVSALGYRVTIAADAIQWTDTKGLGTVSKGVYTAGNTTGESTLQAKLGNTTVSIPVSIGTQDKVVDFFETLNMTFSGYPEGVTGGISLVGKGRNNSNAVKLDYDFTSSDQTRAAYMNYGNSGLALPGTPSKIGVWVFAEGPSTQWIRGTVTDSKGGQHVIDFKKGVDWKGWKYLEATVPSGITAPTKLSRIYVAEPDSGQKVKGSLIFDDLQVSFAGKANSTTTTKEIKDPLYRAYEKQGKTIMAHSGLQVAKETLQDRLVINNLVEKANRQQTQILFTGAADKKATSKITNTMTTAGGGHAKQEIDDLLIIKMDNSKNGFRATNFNQWPWFKDLIEKNQKSNVIILLPKPIRGENGFTDALEADLFEEILAQQAESGKNIFVLHGGKELKVEPKNGVRYITTGTYQSNSSKMPSEANQYIEFNLNGTDLTYQIKSLFN